MKYCQKCGKKLKEGGKFCPYCGNSLNLTLKESQLRKDKTIRNARGSKKGIVILGGIIVLLMTCAVLCMVYFLYFCSKPLVAKWEPTLSFQEYTGEEYFDSARFFDYTNLYTLNNIQFYNVEFKPNGIWHGGTQTSENSYEQTGTYKVEDNKLTMKINGDYHVEVVPEGEDVPNHSFEYIFQYEIDGEILKITYEDETIELKKK